MKRFWKSFLGTHILLKKKLNFGFISALCVIDGLLFIVHLTKTQITKAISKNTFYRTYFAIRNTGQAKPKMKALWQKKGTHEEKFHKYSLIEMGLCSNPLTFKILSLEFAFPLFITVHLHHVSLLSSSFPHHFFFGWVDKFQNIRVVQLQLTFSTLLALKSDTSFLSVPMEPCSCPVVSSITYRSDALRLHTWPLLLFKTPRTRRLNKSVSRPLVT